MRRNDCYSDNNEFGNNVAGAGASNNDPMTIYRPTRNVVNTRTNRRTKRVIHPTHIKNVNKNIVRVENFYPVTESNVNETIIEEYNCGSDINRPNCRRVGSSRPCNCRSKCDCRKNRGWF